MLEIFQDGKELARECTLIRIRIHRTLQYSHVFFVFDSCSFNSLLVLALLALSRGDFSFQVTQSLFVRVPQNLELVNDGVQSFLSFDQLFVFATSLRSILFHFFV